MQTAKLSPEIINALQSFVVQGLKNNANNWGFEWTDNYLNKEEGHTPCIAIIAKDYEDLLLYLVSVSLEFTLENFNKFDIDEEIEKNIKNTLYDFKSEVVGSERVYYWTSLFKKTSYTPLT